MIKCQNCDSRLSNKFSKVYGNEDGTVYRCIHCVKRENGGRSVLRHGGAAIKDIKEVQRRMNTK